MKKLNFVFVLCFLLMILGCSNNKNSPKDTLEKFLSNRYSSSEDYDLTYSLISSEDKRFKSKQEYIADIEPPATKITKWSERYILSQIRYKIIGIKIEAEKATAKVKLFFKWPKEHQEEGVYTLVKEKDGWKLFFDWANNPHEVMWKKIKGKFKESNE